MNQKPFDKQIVITAGGPYFVLGGLPLVHMRQVVSPHGEPLDWQQDGAWQLKECYVLCRCGNSHEKPFCDGTHCKVGFDGRETADLRPIAERQVILPGSAQLIVRRDDTLCMEAGFCATRLAKIDDLLLAVNDLKVRSQVVAMIERCPSGALTYSPKPGEAEVEPVLPLQVAVTTEYTSAGMIRGALWVTGGVLIERSDGLPLERRNRVTLCCCGQSENKPFCDGKHRLVGGPMNDLQLPPS